MNFVTVQDYSLIPYTLPNLDEPTFDAYVTREQAEILTELLGRYLYEAFIAGIAEDPIPARWLALKDGANYTHEEKGYRWKGMHKMLVPFMYAMYTRDTFDNHSDVGIVVGTPENSTTISPSQRICRAYNSYSLLAGSECRLKDTLYGYLHESGDTYVNDIAGSGYTDIKKYLCAVYKDPGSMNLFNI